MKYTVSLNGKKYEVEVEQGKARAVYAGKAEPVMVKKEAAAAPAPAPEKVQEAAPAEKPAAAAGAGNVLSCPMPGKIVKVNAAVGQKVKASDVLFVLEAMKMENEITAGQDGTVTSVTASVGQNVETGAELCRIA